MTEPTIIVARVLRDSGDAVQIDPGTDHRPWVPKHLVDMAPMGEPLKRAPGADPLTDTEYVEVSMPADLAMALGVA